MSNEELAIRIRDGEEDLIPQLWEQVETFIRWKARNYMTALVVCGTSPAFELDDLVQESYFAMLKAVDYFNAERGGFLHILELQCRYAFAVVAGFKGAKKTVDAMYRAVSGDAPLADDSEAVLLDIIPDPGEAIEDVATASLYQQQLHNALERALAGLTTQQEKILRRRYYQGETQAKVAFELGCSESNIERREHAALRHLYNSRSLNGLNEFLETHTNYYARTGVTPFKNSGMSSVEAITIRREELARKWLASQKVKGGFNEN